MKENDKKCQQCTHNTQNKPTRKQQKKQQAAPSLSVHAAMRSTQFQIPQITKSSSCSRLSSFRRLSRSKRIFNSIKSNKHSSCSIRRHNNICFIGYSNSSGSTSTGRKVPQLRQEHGILKYLDMLQAAQAHHFVWHTPTPPLLPVKAMHANTICNGFVGFLRSVQTVCTDLRKPTKISTKRLSSNLC